MTRHSTASFTTHREPAAESKWGLLLGTCASQQRDLRLRMIIGMAIRGYSYDPTKARSEKIGEIAGDLDELGIGLDPDTIRKYLREATELLPRSEDEVRRS